MAQQTGIARLGRSVPDSPATAPSSNIELSGQHVTLVHVSPGHASNLYKLLEGPDNISLFDYLFDEPPASAASLETQLTTKASSTNPWFYTLMLNATSEEPAKAVGMVSLMRMDLPSRVIEVGNILFTPALQRTPAATEAMYLLARYVFQELGFRRYEWKCNSLNTPSRRAAERIGFQYEGTFRQHMIVKGHNRDTAWFSMLDSDWPVVRNGFEQWLGGSNFDGADRQIRKLEDLRNAR
jgi:RimJ/RimL family protein N-acetyltransferase